MVPVDVPSGPLGPRQLKSPEWASLLHNWASLIHDDAKILWYKFRIEEVNYPTHFVSEDSRDQLEGIVRHSSPAWVNLKTSLPNTQGWFLSLLRPVPKGDTFHCVTWKEALTMDWLFSLVACYVKSQIIFENLQSCFFTRYLSVATDTKITSSPTRTFSPSDLCFDAGCTVHQHASPKYKIHLKISE